MSFIDVESIERAARRLESAASEASRAADRLETAVHALRMLTEDGYGNNVSVLIELLRQQEQKEPQ